MRKKIMITICTIIILAACFFIYHKKTGDKMKAEQQRLEQVEKERLEQREQTPSLGEDSFTEF